MLTFYGEECAEKFNLESFRVVYSIMDNIVLDSHNCKGYLILLKLMWNCFWEPCDFVLSWFGSCWMQARWAKLMKTIQQMLVDILAAVWYPATCIIKIKPYLQGIWQEWKSFGIVLQQWNLLWRSVEVQVS